MNTKISIESSSDASNEYLEIKTKFSELHDLYKKYFPKVDPLLIQEIYLIAQIPKKTETGCIRYRL